MKRREYKRTNKPIKHTVCDSLRYAAAVGAIYNSDCAYWIKIVLDNHKNNNQRMSREIFETAKSYKAGILYRSDASYMISEIINEGCDN